MIQQKPFAAWLLLTALACLWPIAASAQVYRWVGPDGKVQYTDTPPPASARQIEARGGGSSDAQPVLPYALQQAARNFPATLYTTANCAPCDEARRLLAARGVPVSEKTVSTREDIAAWQKNGPGGQLPVLALGSKLQQGYEPQAWQQALTQAGYPGDSQLPAGWRNPPPSPLVAPNSRAASTTPAAAPSTPSKSADSLPPPAGNAPPGFRF